MLQDNSLAACRVPQSCDVCYGRAQSTAYAGRCPPRRSPADSVYGNAAGSQNTGKYNQFLSLIPIALTPLLLQAMCLMPGPQRSRSHQLYCLPATKWSRKNWSRATKAAEVTKTDILHKIKRNAAKFLFKYYVYRKIYEPRSARQTDWNWILKQVPLLSQIDLLTVDSSSRLNLTLFNESLANSRGRLYWTFLSEWIAPTRQTDSKLCESVNQA